MYKIVELTSKEECIKHTKHSGWCTGKTDNNHYESLYSRGKLFAIYKTKRKRPTFQLYVNPEGKTEFRRTGNQSLDINKSIQEDSLLEDAVKKALSKTEFTIEQLNKPKPNENSIRYSEGRRNTSLGVDYELVNVMHESEFSFIPRLENYTPEITREYVSHSLAGELCLLEMGVRREIPIQTGRLVGSRAFQYEGQRVIGIIVSQQEMYKLQRMGQIDDGRICNIPVHLNREMREGYKLYVEGEEFRFEIDCREIPLEYRCGDHISINIREDRYAMDDQFRQEHLMHELHMHGAPIFRDKVDRDFRLDPRYEMRSRTVDRSYSTQYYFIRVIR